MKRHRDFFDTLQQVYVYVPYPEFTLRFFFTLLEKGVRSIWIELYLSHLPFKYNLFMPNIW